MKPSFKESVTIGLLTAGVAAIINALLFQIFKKAGILTSDILIQPGTSLTIAPVVISSVFTSIVGGIAYFLFEKFMRNGYRNFLIFSIAFLLISFSGPFRIPGVTMGYAIVLNLMHIVVAATLFYFIKRKRSS